MNTTKLPGHRNPPPPPKEIEQTVPLTFVKSTIVEVMEAFREIIKSEFIIVDKKGNVIEGAEITLKPDHKSIVHDYIVPRMKKIGIEINFNQ